MKHTHKLVTDVLNEILSQDEKWGPDRTHPNTYPKLNPDLTDRVWYHMYEPVSWYKKITDTRAQDGTISWADIILEEVAEAIDEMDADKLVAELVQVAAVALQWANDVIEKNGVQA